MHAKGFSRKRPSSSQEVTAERSPCLCGSVRIYRDGSGARVARLLRSSTSIPRPDTLVVQPKMATLVFGDATDPQSISLPAGLAPWSPAAEAGRYILEPDPAVIAADATDDLAALLTAQGTPAWRIAAGLDWLSADDPVDTPFARVFRILKTAPGRERDITAAIAELDGGIVEIKPRGVALNTDALQKRLRGDGSRRVDPGAAGRYRDNVGLAPRAAIAAARVVEGTGTRDRGASAGADA